MGKHMTASGRGIIGTIRWKWDSICVSLCDKHPGEHKLTNNPFWHTKMHGKHKCGNSHHWI